MGRRPQPDGLTVSAEGWTVLLDAMPASNDEQYKIVLHPPLPRDDGTF